MFFGLHPCEDESRRGCRQRGKEDQSGGGRRSLAPIGSKENIIDRSERKKKKKKKKKKRIND